MTDEAQLNMPPSEGRPATMKDVRQLVRRRLKRVPPHDENSLNIYPMMDMMTILLVFMIMQFANSSASIIESENLKIPFSTSEVEPEDAVPIQVSLNEISVDGHGVLPLRVGHVDASQKQGGGTGFLITPLLNTMQNHRDRLKLIAQRNPNRPFKGEVQIIADNRTPFRTLAEIIYTLGQSEFKSMRFVVLKQTGD